VYTLPLVLLSRQRSVAVSFQVQGPPWSADLSSPVSGYHLSPAREAHASDDVLEYREATRRFQRRYLLDVLTECDWSISDAVRSLGLARSQLYNLIAIFELKRPKDHASS
jgi:DNA-binding NtrC family response regulator